MTLNFRPVTLADAPRLRPYFALSPSPQLVDCFEAFYLWRDVLRVEWAEHEGFAIFRVEYEPGVPTFLFPFGAGDPAPALLAMRASGMARSVSKVRAEQTPYIKDIFPDAAITADRDRAEYLYPTDLFRTYTGKALQPKRNFVNYARANFDWRYEAVTADNLAECQRFASTFQGDDSFTDDSAALQNALADWPSLDLAGGILRTDGSISALFICAMLGDGETAAGLFLRGDHEKKGVIPLLYQVYFLHHPEFKHFNFGEDLGVEGLRKNKLSFRPEEILALYEVAF